jgi:Mg2+ and Co2+ transporter CorA
MTAFASQCYLELIKKKQDHIRRLQEFQEKIQHHEHTLVLVKQDLAIYHERKHTFDVMVNQLIASKEWVTAEKHRQIYNYDEALTKEYADIVSRKRERQDLIDLHAGEAASVYRHLLGIEKGLTSLKSHLATLSDKKKAFSKGFLKRWWWTRKTNVLIKY